MSLPTARKPPVGRRRTGRIAASAYQMAGWSVPPLETSCVRRAVPQSRRPRHQRNVPGRTLVPCCPSRRTTTYGGRGRPAAACSHWRCCRSPSHVFVSKEAHLIRILKSYFAYYHEARTHLLLNRNAPITRRVEPPSHGCITGTRGQPEAAALSNPKINGTRKLRAGPAETLASEPFGTGIGRRARPSQNHPAHGAPLRPSRMTLSGCTPRAQTCAPLSSGRFGRSSTFGTTGRGRAYLDVAPTSTRPLTAGTLAANLP